MRKPDHECRTISHAIFSSVPPMSHAETSGGNQRNFETATQELQQNTIHTWMAHRNKEANTGPHTPHKENKTERERGKDNEERKTKTAREKTKRERERERAKRDEEERARPNRGRRGTLRLPIKFFSGRPERQVRIIIQPLDT